MAARKSRSDSSTVPNLPPSSLPFSNLRSSSKRKEMSSYPPINLFGLNLEPRRKAFTAPTRSEEECAECAVVCPQSPCAPVELTSMCTARCVVIACDDPEHDNPSLRCPLIAAGKLHCDLECQEGSTDCPDCNRFDNFLGDHWQDFQPPLEEQKPFAEPSPAWDPVFEDFLCACACKEPLDKSSNVGTCNFAPTPHSPGDTNYLSQPIQHYPAPTTTQHSNSMPCMWGDCHETFSSTEDLVAHVNGQHLRLPSAPPPGLAPLSCLWGDCNEFHSPMDISLDLLSSHLFQEHLGLQLASSSSSSSSTPPLENMPRDLGSMAATSSMIVNTLTLPPELEVEVHNCHGTHVCNWRSCGKAFTSCDDLTGHLNSEHVGAGKAHYECFWGDCGRNGEKGFGSKQKICRHLQSHTGHRPFQCKICQQNFSEAATLQQHMRRHTQEKPYVCDYPGCGKSFAITGALTIHKRIHNGHKPFKCTYCDRAFAESSNLSKHLRTHTGARPYPCTEPGCSKTFARPDQLTRHMGVHRRKSKMSEDKETEVN